MQTKARNPIIALLTLAVAFVAFSWAADYAEADTHTTTLEFTGEDFYIPRPADRSDQVGVERLLASVDVPAELQGLTCSVAGTSANGESVHPNNYGMLRSNGDFVRIDGTEDEANGVRLSDKSIVLGATVQLFNVMLGDPVATSVSYEVRVTCTQDDTTTTTTAPEPSTTTSSSTTTSTPSEATTSSTTSSTVPDSSTTTSTPPATTTTAPTETTTTFTWESTSTTEGSSTSTTVQPEPTTSSSLIEQDTTTTIPPTTEETLPFTGPPVGAAGIAMAGVAMLVLGAGVLLGVRRES